MREFFEKVLTAASVAAVIGLFLYAFSAYADDRDSQFFTQAVDPIVQIDRSCSAVAFSQTENATYLITALHCKNGASGVVNVDIKERQKVIAQTSVVYDVLRVDLKQDLMTIKTRQRLNVNTVTIAQSDPLEGEKAWAVGYPIARTRTIVDGYVGQWESLDADLNFDDEYGNKRALLRATPPITGGNSGGALFVKNNGNYELVGISDAGFNDFGEAAFFVPQDAIREIVGLTIKYDVALAKAVEEDKRSHE